ncbi:MAG: hypothetical protein WCT44_00610 [Candidatus Paceibacterota bacterium]
MYRINKTLVYFLILTIVSSMFAYRIIAKAYDNAFAYNDYLIE